MGMVKRDIDKGRRMADVFDYGSTAALKTALRSLHKLRLSAEQGCPTAQAILIDLKTALGEYKSDEVLGRVVVTDRQKEAIVLHLIDDRSLQETAQLLGVDPTAISHRVASGLKRMMHFLQTGRAA
ncbi:hypothetical protein CIG75_03220 [Tumebacillus algifaecis]|uniref:RNA polymerase sigma factor 70 region 4 type 2 domain-containing protein n=2 Tax=Tumebacillus algifaecis TaxID=1214604 RepID=A0A223CYA0_9BACL|nr:hypothetical protein CIG75_03220 [Tumebacillus algifaecis]